MQTLAAGKVAFMNTPLNTMPIAKTSGLQNTKVGKVWFPRVIFSLGLKRKVCQKPEDAGLFAGSISTAGGAKGSNSIFTAA
jgi:hypothetical protein